MKKLSLFLAILMILSSVYIPAFAAVASTDEAKIGDTGYATLEAAVAAAKDSGGTVELLKDAVIDDPAGINITPTQDFTINGNGHTVTSNISTKNRATFYVQAKTVTIKNMVFETSLNGSDTWGAIISKNAGTHVILDGCTVNVRGSAGHGAYGFIFGGKLTLKNTVTTSVFKGFYFYNADASSGTVVAEGTSKLIAPAVGDTTVSGLTFLKSDNPFAEKTVATVGTENFSSIEKAVAYAAANGGTVELLDDVTVLSGDGINLAASGTSPTKDFTVDGKGHKIISAITTAYRATFYVGAKTVTCKDVIFETTTSNANAWGAIASRYEGTHVILDGCTVNVNGAAGSCAIGMNTKGKVTLKNTTVTTGFNAFLDFAGDGTVLAEGNSSVNAPFLGIDPVNGLTHVKPEITMLEGAAIRLRENSNGIRFTSVVSKDSVDRLEQMKTAGIIASYSFGTLISKKDALEGIDFTVAALTAAGKGSESFVDISAKKGLSADPVSGDITINAALVNIKLTHYDTEFAAISYIEYQFANGTTTRTYGEFAAANHVRTIKQIAYEALCDVSATQTEEKVNPVTSYYVKDGEGYKKMEGDAFSQYGSEQRTILQNYIDGVLNFDPEAVKPLAEKTSDVVEHTDDIFLPVGRTYIRNGGLACDFTCTGIRFNATCEGSVLVNINTTGDTYFTVYVDGERQEKRIKASASTTWIEIVSGLERGEHEIMLVKQSQFTMATTELKQVKIYGKFAEEIPAQKELFIEFYGDSILNGSNIFLGGTSAYTSDGTQAFGWLTAQALNADCNIIGCGGLGLSVSGSDFVMNDVWNLNGSLKVSGVTEYDFERTPDVVVVELGVNDEARKTQTTEMKYKTAVLEFVKNIRKTYGEDVPIVWVYGYHDKSYWALTKEVLDNAYDGETDNIYYCELTKSYLTSAQGGDGYHPDVNTSKVMAEELTAFLKRILPGFAS